MKFPSGILRFMAVFVLAPLLYFGTVHANPVLRNSVSNLHITSFGQDNSGYLWIATAKGLSRYNSYEYFQYYNYSENPRSIPSDIVTGIFRDSAGELWIATDSGICRYVPLSDDFTRCTYDKTLKPSYDYGFCEFGGRLLAYGVNGLKEIDRQTMSVRAVAGTEGLVIQTVVPDAFGKLWIGSRIGSNAICWVDKTLSEVHSLPIDPSVDVLSSYVAPNGRIWFGTNQGVMTVDPLAVSVAAPSRYLASHPVLSKLHITFFHQVDDRDLLIGTQNQGLFVFDLSNGDLVRSSKSEYFPALASSHCTTCFTDRDRTIWLGTFDKGFFTENYMAGSFNNNSFLNAFFAGKFVTRIVEGPSGDIWFGTRYNGLIHYDGNTKTVTEYNGGNFAPFTRANSDFIQSLLLDSKGNLWVGYDKYLLRCRLEGSRITSYRVYGVNSDIVTMADDGHGRIWAGSSLEGITVFDIDMKEPPRVLLMESVWNNVTNIIRLRSGEMLLSVFDDGLYIANPATFEVRPMLFPPAVEPQAERCISLLEASTGGLWIGTYGRGVAQYSPSTGFYSVYTTASGLPSSDVLTVAEAADGTVWMSTSDGLSKYDPATRIFLNFHDYDGIGGNQFHEKAVMCSQSGKLWFGGNHGVTYFDPEEIIPDNHPVPVILEDLKIMNISEVPGADGSVLSRNIAYTDAITLNHRQSVFSIDYSGINFVSPQKVKYAYRLRNFERDWNYVNDYRRATYSNLSPGHYVFEVIAQNPDGTGNTDAPTTLDITVKPAPWFSPWAYAAYLVFGALIIIVLSRLQINRKLDRQRIVFIEKERKLEQEMNELKIRFFTNISHELRTPLSMIYGPAKQLRDNSLDAPTREYLLELLTGNADNLLYLIDQLMDFAKLESDTLSLAVAECDPAAIACEMIRSYSYYANEKKIGVVLDAPGIADMWIDPDKIRKILSNLLSNALKYTPDGGHVTIRMRQADKAPAGHETDAGNSEWLVVEVEDNGIGMSREEMGHLFKRHKRVTLNAGISGKGIGLHYVKSLVEIHKGVIVPHLVDPHGMVFMFAVPVGRNSYSTQELQMDEPGHKGAAGRDIRPQYAIPEISPGCGDTERRMVLVVEDNTDLSAFIAHLLGRQYRVLTAFNGAEGLEKARSEEVDLIVSDVLMPEMNGYELCAAIKGDPELSHIPFVILTAKMMDIDHIEGYSQGADAYVNKPFNPELLETIVRNQFAAVQRRAEYISKHSDFGDWAARDGKASGEETIKLGALDRDFFEKLYALFDANLSDSRLNINSMAKEMAISRTSLYRKVKALTGDSPNNFLRNYRLNKAAGLIVSRKYSINEIVDITGFGTHPYFSSCFKKKFGVNPKDYNKSVDTEKQKSIGEEALNEQTKYFLAQL